MKLKSVKIGSLVFDQRRPLGLLAGPCVIESDFIMFKTAKSLKAICQSLKVPYVFKASYDKANRSSISSYRGPGLTQGLSVLSRIKKELGVPILTDVHTPEEAYQAGRVVDIIQIPAFLCRQTDLLIAAGKSGAVVNIKKGQFMAPWDMINAIKKVESTGNKRIMLTERGFSFGYNNLVVDMRGLEVMKSFGYPVIYDATHSVQLPGGKGTSSGGQSEFIWPLARAAVGLGVTGLFMEVHPQPTKALSDGPNSARLADMRRGLGTLVKIDRVVKKSV